jgi:MFS family permease
MGMAIGAVSRRVPHLVEKTGRRSLALAGLVMMATGMVLLSTLDETSGYWLVLGGIVPVGVGMALAMAPATTDIVAAVPLHKQGVASATNDAAREVGGTLGIAVLGSVLNDQYRAGVAAAAPETAPEGLVDTAQESLGAALGIAARLGERGDALAAGARTAFVDGLADAFLVSAGALLLCAVVFAVVIPRRRTPDEPRATIPASLPGTSSRPSEPARLVSSTTFRNRPGFQPWVMFLR